jgi:nitrite reductase/ring-hydroxylating ferredoxin subunit
MRSAHPGATRQGSRFDITTGAVINGPATVALNVYEAQEVEGSIRIRA